MNLNTRKFSHISLRYSRYGLLGNIHGFFYDYQGLPRFCIGPDCNFYQGMFFIGMWFFIAGLGYGLSFIIGPQISPTYTLIGFVLVTYTLIMYLITALKNPGIQLPNWDEELKSDENYCNICDIITNQQTEHCLDCDVCILEYDHHCPWTSKCIGKGNIRWFQSFLAGVILLLIYIIAALSTVTKTI